MTRSALPLVLLLSLGAAAHAGGQEGEVCSLPPDPGPCDATYTRWFFNPESGRCERFTWGGCEGNGNNFETLKECMAGCGGPWCPSDLDGSGDVGFDDLLRVLASWGSCLKCPEDLDGDGSVDFDELLMVLSDWGPCP
jgi:hypothetical protein